MTGSLDDDTTGAQYVVNELLVYVFNHMKKHPMDSIKTVLLDFYCAEAISEAKKKLWDSFTDQLPSFERRTNRGQRNANEKEVDDILNSMKIIDAKFSDIKTLPVVFVAVNLSQLPNVNPGELETVSLLERVTRLERQMATVVQPPGKTFASVVSSAKKSTNDRPRQEPRSRQQLMVNLPSQQNISAGTWSDTATCDNDDNEGFILPPEQIRKLRKKEQRESETERPKTKPKTKPVYGTRQDTQIRAGPRRCELFVFRVDKEIEDDQLGAFLASEQVKVHELECISKPEAWTKSYRIAVETPDPSAILQPDFWPDGIGCRRFWKKRT